MVFVQVSSHGSTSPFQLHSGTRKGGLVSHFLFAVAIEPLAIWLRSEEKFESISCLGTIRKLSLYADDLLLYVLNPSTSLPIVLNILKRFDFNYQVISLILGSTNCFWLIIYQRDCNVI